MDEIIVVVIIAITLMFMTTSSSNVNTSVQLFAQAIATAEGFFAQGASPNIPQQANNPGDLTAGDVDDTGIYIVASGGIQIIQYATVDDGWTALYQKLNNILNGLSQSYNSNMTLAQFAQTYSGSSNGTWMTNVMTFLNNNGVQVNSSMTLSEILS